MFRPGRFLVLLPLLCALSARCGEPVSAPPPPLPEGDTGLAAKYLGDFGIDKDPAVLFTDGWESGLAAWDNSWGGATTTKVSANVHTGKEAMELTMVPPKPGGETSLGVQQYFKKEGHDVIFMRYYMKLEKSMDMFRHNHANCCIAARAPGVPNAKPGIPADGRNEFTVALEPFRMDEKTPAPGEWNIYCYHPDQRSQWGDHFFPTGLICPQPGRNAPVDLFGKDFVKRPSVVPERDRWYCYELMVKANTPGKRDGRIAIWIDGRLIADFVNLRLRDVETLKANRVGFGMSTLNSKATQPNTMWYDDVVVATSYIGPMAKKKAAPVSLSPAAGPPAAEKPAQPKIDPKALAQWEARLVERVARGIKDGQRPTAHLKVMGSREEPVKVAGADDKSLFVEIQGNSLPFSWQKMTLSDRLSLARAFSKEGSADDLLLVGVFALADGRTELSDDSFSKAQAADPKGAPARISEARASLGLK